MTSRALKKLGQQRLLEYYEPPEKKQVLTPKPFIPNEGSQSLIWELTKEPQNFSFDALWYIGGINNGKSFSGSAFCVRRSQQDPKGRGLITANTYGQLETSTLMALAEFCEYHNIPLDPCEERVEDTARTIANRRYCYVNGVYHFVLSAELFTGKTERSKEAGRGLQVRWGWYDEGAYGPESSLATMSGRVGRGPGNSRGLILITSSINKNEPKNWAYSKFLDEDRDDVTKKAFLAVIGQTQENPHAGQAYLDKMRATLTPELFALECQSQIVAVATDRIAYHFKPDIHLISPEIAAYNPVLPLHITFDFNNSPSCAIAAQLHEDETSEELIIIKEWYLVDGDGTYNLSKQVVDWVKELFEGEEVIRRYVNSKGNKVRTRSHSLFISGDASGKQKTANSLLSNWQIVFKEFAAANLKTISLIGTFNPNLVDSFNQINNVLYHRKVFVNRKCKELVKDLEVCKKDRTGGVDKTDKKRSHLFDCFRYLLWDIFPVFRMDKAAKDKVKVCG